jgi:hypothetical protein
LSCGDRALPLTLAPSGTGLGFAKLSLRTSSLVFTLSGVDLTHDATSFFVCILRIVYSIIKVPVQRPLTVVDWPLAMPTAHS